MDERKRLTFELMAMKNKDEFIIDSYNEQISKLSREIESATAAPDFMAWWKQVQDEIDLLRQQQAQVKNAIEKGSYVQKADAIRRIIRPNCVPLGICSFDRWPSQERCEDHLPICHGREQGHGKRR